MLEQRHGIDFKLAIPTVILGHDHVLGYPKGVSVWTVPFSLAESRFYLEICYREKKAL
jgi:CheY-specific phosphatase CheX